MRDAILYAVFFVSGAAALVYQVAWIRSLSLIFGGSHLAVTTVLAVFMGGLALGGRLFGRRVEQWRRPLRVYGLLELGIAASALVFLALDAIYPHLYVPLARIAGDDRSALSAIRVAFAVVALLVPTTLMGGTLPVLAHVVTRRPGSLAGRLSFLYGFNTLGAVAGSLAAGFALLPALGLRRTLALAIATNVVVGLVALAWRDGPAAPGHRDAAGSADADDVTNASPIALRFVLVGIGVSGFCALGYEVLWTRVLGMVTGTSIYPVTTMLVAFLLGIGLGSQAFGFAHRRWGARSGPGRMAVVFGAVQVAIGVCALGVTWAMRDLPAHAAVLQHLVSSASADEFRVRLGAGFAVAFAYMFVPAFFMGVAFPLAGTVHAAARGRAGAAVGEVLTVNTVGAILGAAVSGYVLVHAVGVERALQILAALNVGFGAVVAASALRRRAVVPAVAASATVLIGALVLWPDWGRLWDRKYFAVFSNNVRDVFVDPKIRHRFVENTEVLYYHEGVNETISVVRAKSGLQGVVVNGRTEASTAPADLQCQRALGHVPMLLHPNPRRVFVLGLGTGMTLGATAIHPEVEQVTLAEIEPAVEGAARTFARYNHDALDNPKLKKVFNDGRNVLLTTPDTFDVITADPVQPWSAGAAYLFTSEYYALMASRLRPGGIACQWLPLYEMSVQDVQTVVRTFAEQFRHVVVWQTHYDAEVIGSNAPIVLDPVALEERLAHPAVRQSLAEVDMGAVNDFLGFFLMGDHGARSYAAGGVVNTDDNLHLEFSTPRSQGIASRMAENVEVLARFREDVGPYLTPPAAAPRGSGGEIARLYDRAHVLGLRGAQGAPEFEEVRTELERLAPDYAPFRFLRREIAVAEGSTPVPRGSVALKLLSAGRTPRVVVLTAVAMRFGPSRAVVVVVDNDSRDVYGEVVLDGADAEARIPGVASAILAAVRDVHAHETVAAGARGSSLPEAETTLEAIRKRLAAGNF